MNPFVEVWGILGGGLGFLISIPQLIRVVKNKSQVGVSLTTWIFITMSTFGWTAYGVRYNSFSQITTNSIAAVLAVVLTFILLRSRVSIAGAIGVLVAIAVPTVLVVSFAPVLIMEIWLYMALWSRIPQMLTSYRSMRLGRVTVVSTSTYLLSAVSGLAWVVYGILTGLDAVAYFSAAILVFSALVVVFERIAVRRAAALGSSAPA